MPNAHHRQRVVLQTSMRPLWVSTRGCRWGLGTVDSMGRLQQVMWRWCVIFQSSLRQPQANHWGQVLSRRETEAPILQH